MINYQEFIMRVKSLQEYSAYAYDRARSARYEGNKAGFEFYMEIASHAAKTARVVMDIEEPT